MERDKKSLRLKFQEASLCQYHPGKTAESLRKQPEYRQSKILFVSPSPQLHQIRINALLDGKLLLMPGPAIKKGFYRFAPYKTSFKDLGHATSLKGVELFGKLLDGTTLKGLHVDMALTDCQAVDPSGGRLGQGTGFFDLAMGLLAELGGVDGETVFCAVGVQEQVVEEDLPQDSWDVKMNFFLHEEGMVPLQAGNQHPAILWDDLEKKRIRKVEPLWQLYKERFPESDSEVSNVWAKSLATEDTEK